MPRVSVIMPTYNALPYLRTALESIQSQTLRDIEVIVLNDCSTDGTASYLDSLDDPRVRVVHCEKQGYVPLLNLGLRLAQAEFVARMDADDVSLPDRLERQFDFMQRHSDVAVCGCQAQQIDYSGRTVGQLSFPVTDVAIRFQLMLHSAIPHPGAMYRRREILALGGYEPALMPAEDYDLWCRASVGMKLANVPEVLLQYRVHDSNVSTVESKARHNNANSVAIRHLVQNGLATTRVEAERCRAILAALNQPGPSRWDANAGAAFCAVMTRFFSAAPVASSPDNDIQALRRGLGWLCLRKAQLSRSPLGFARWVGLARLVDSEYWSARAVTRRAVTMLMSAGQ